MKKIIAFLLALTLALSTFGCNKQTTPPVTSPNATADSTTPTETTAPEKEGVYTVDNYTVSDEEALAQRETVVATVGDAKLTNGLLQIYYWTSVYSFLSEYGSYVIYYGLDVSKPLSQQTFYSGEGTWEQFFLSDALKVWHRYQALELKNQELNLPLSDKLQEELDGTEKMLQESAQKNGFDSIDALLAAEMGAGCTLEDYLRYSQLLCTSNNYYDHMYAQISITDTDIEAYFMENENALKKEGITKDTLNYAVRHILISPKSAQGSSTYTDEEWAACKAEAQALLDQWKAGDATEDSFAALAKEHSTDPGSKDNGGLYEGLSETTSFVEPFKNWYLEEGRKPGDTGLVKTDYGYHIMYFSGAKTIWMDHIRNILDYNASVKIVNDAINATELTVDYNKICLATVDLNAQEAE